MEFTFRVNDIFRQPLVEIGPNLIPPGFVGDRRKYWDTVGKVSEVINAMGEASAAAQGLSKPITTAERLRNSEHTIYLLVDQTAGHGRGAVIGLLKTGKKGLYVFDRNGQHFQVSPPCLLDFYVHESRQRNGLGKQLYEHMLQKEKVAPVKMAIDRPSEKLLGFLNKHYQLNTPVKQMNNYVVFDGFFPSKQEQSTPVEITTESVSKKLSANGLQSAPRGRYGAPRPTCSMGQIIHNQSSTLTKSPEPASIRSAPETNIPKVTTDNPSMVTQSTPNVYLNNSDNHGIERVNNQQTSEGVWQNMNSDHLNKPNQPNNQYYQQMVPPQQYPTVPTGELHSPRMYQYPQVPPEQIPPTYQYPQVPPEAYQYQTAPTEQLYQNQAVPQEQIFQNPPVPQEQIYQQEQIYPVQPVPQVPIMPEQYQYQPQTLEPLVPPQSVPQVPQQVYQNIKPNVQVTPSTTSQRQSRPETYYKPQISTSVPHYQGYNNMGVAAQHSSPVLVNSQVPQSVPPQQYVQNNQAAPMQPTKSMSDVQRMQYYQQPLVNQEVVHQEPNIVPPQQYAYQQQTPESNEVPPEMSHSDAVQRSFHQNGMVSPPDLSENSMERKQAEQMNDKMMSGGDAYVEPEIPTSGYPPQSLSSRSVLTIPAIHK